MANKMYTNKGLFKYNKPVLMIIFSSAVCEQAMELHYKIFLIFRVRVCLQDKNVEREKDTRK